LLAASFGSLESVQWFLTDIPLHHYLEFAKSKRGQADQKVKSLDQTPGGFERAVSKWLTKRSESSYIFP